MAAICRIRHIEKPVNTYEFIFVHDQEWFVHGVEQVATVWVQYGLVASSNEDIRNSVLRGYEKTQPPGDDVELMYKIAYARCPILDSATGTLTSKVNETQVRLTSFFLNWLAVCHHFNGCKILSTVPSSKRQC